MSDILLDGTLAPNGPFALARSANIFGAPIIAANLTALQNWVNTGTMAVGQLGYATDTSIYYKLTAIGTPHTWTRIDVVKNAVESSIYGDINVVEPVTSDYNFWTTAAYWGSQLHVNVGFLGGSGVNGQLLVYDTEGNARVNLDGQVGGNSFFLDQLYIHGGLADNYATTAIKLGDGSNTSFNTTNKTIVGAVNEILSSNPTYSATGDINVTTWTAPTASAPTTKIRLTKIGKLVTLYLLQWNANGDGTTGSILSGSGVIPAAYRPTSGEGQVWGGLNTYGAGTTQWGAVIVDVDGSISIGNNYNADQFVTTNGVPFGFQNCAISWMLA